MPLPPPVQLLLQRFLILLSFIFPAPLTFVPTSSVSPTKFGAAPGVPFAATPAEGCGWNPRASPAQRGAGAVGMEHLWEDSKAAWRAPSGTPGREGEGAPRAAPTAPRGAEGRAWRGGGRGEPRDGGALQLELGALADSIRPLRAELSCLEDDSQRAQQEEWHRSSRGLRRELQSEERRAAHLSHERRRLEARAAEHDVQRGVLRAEIKAAREQPPGSLGPPGDEVEARRRRDELDRMVGCFHAELCEYGTVERGRHGEHETLEREVAALRASLRGHGDLEREVERLRGCLDAHHQLEREVERLRADQHELQGVSREVERLRGCQDAHHQLEREVERLRSCQDIHHELEREVDHLRGCQDAHHQLEREVERLRGCQDAHHQLEREVERLRADQHELQGVSREVERLRGCQDAHHQLEREVERLRSCQDAHHQLEREVERLRSCQHAHQELEYEIERLRGRQGDFPAHGREAGHLERDGQSEARGDVERLGGQQVGQLEREREELELPRGGSARSARSASLSAGARSARSERREQQDDALLREELVGAMALKKRLRAEVGQEAGAEPRARLEEADRAVGVLREARAGLAEAAERAAAALERPPARSCAWPGARRALEARRDPARDVVLRGAGDGIGVSVGSARTSETLCLCCLVV
ncbi:unnamed protein product [Prorocentrum cordatum]|uniref:Uncharacterized protein n=1 Tax=Prorocentrum cordatum TaxID=2364126 RepID=A0ABN9R967_9DINO|nr:unnamed protein product [Polarella glacialis]